MRFACFPVFREKAFRFYAGVRYFTDELRKFQRNLHHFMEGILPFFC